MYVIVQHSALLHDVALQQKLIRTTLQCLAKLSALAPPTASMH